jgi:hypothetical protein
MLGKDDSPSFDRKSGTKPDRGPRSFRWEIREEVSSFLAAEIGHHGLEGDKCHLLIFLNRFRGRAPRSGQRSKSWRSEIYLATMFSSEGHSTLRSSVADGLAHLKGAPLQLLCISPLSTPSSLTTT